MGVPKFCGPCRRITTTKSRRGLVLFDVVTAILLCLSAWVAHERRCLQREQQANETLEQRYSAFAIGPIFSDLNEVGREPDEQFIDLRELQRGRLYVPIDLVIFHEASVVDNRALEQLACFRYLDSLTFQTSRLDPACEFRPAELCNLTSLDLYRTPITDRQLKGISRLSRLERLSLDAAGLKGDWLKPISGLHGLTVLTIDDGDLSDGAADCLARMKGLTWLDLCHCKIDPRLGPALERLEKLEFLWVCDEPFDDEGLKHLMSLKHLDNLGLSRTAITDVGMASLGTLTSLTHLDLSDTKVGDAGLRRLSKLPKLKVLCIGGTRVTNSCLQTLAAIPSLKFAEVSGTEIKTSSPGFIGVLSEGQWYPDEARKREVEAWSKPEGAKGAKR